MPDLVEASDEFANALTADLHGVLSSQEGIFCEPSSAAGLAGLIKYKAAGKLPRGKKIVITCTGNGLKDIPWALEGAKDPVSVPVNADIAADALGLKKA